MVPGNADEAAGIEVDEEQEEEPPDMLNGTAHLYPGLLQTPHPSFDPHLLASPPLLATTLPASICLHSFIHEELFLSPMPQTDDPGHSLSAVGVTFI